MPYTNSAAFSPRGTIISYENAISAGFIPLAEVKDIAFTGAKFDLAETTNFQSGVFREWLTTLADSGEVSFSGNYLPGETSQTAMLTFFNSGALIAWSIQLPGALGTITFKAYVVSLEHSLPIDKQATISVKLKVTGVVSGF